MAHDEPTRLQVKQALLSFLQMRGLVPTDAQLARIEASEDDAQLARWAQRVVTVGSVEELLGS